MKRMFEGKVVGPETIVVRESDNLTLTFIHDGSIVELDPTTGNVQHWAYVGGRCLGGVFDKNDDLIVAEISKGLLKVDKNTKEITVLSNTADGRPIRYADDVSISPVTGNIYFSDATMLVPEVDSEGNLDITYPATVECLTGASTGRLLEYNPTTRKTTVLIDGIAFANGVTVSGDGSFVLVNESCFLKTRRYWLSGSKKGTEDVFKDKLIGIPDGISTSVDENGQEVFYLAIFSPPPHIVIFTKDYPMIRQMMLYLPKSILSIITPEHGAVLRLNSEGEVTRAWFGYNGDEVTSVTPYKGGLYIGNIQQSYVGYFSL
eukprot:CFRG7240T1